jgi:hypothetical protein
MIIKQIDSLKTRKLELEILKGFQLPQYKRDRVSKEYDNLIKGEQGEKNTAYYLNFDLKNNKNWMVIHDLRIEHDGEVAQIDHLLIGRLLDMYVLETKTFGDKLQMHEDGSFVAIYGNKTFSIPSPVEQNNRHIRLLRLAIKKAKILPTRLGIHIPASYKNFVLLDPKTQFVRPSKTDSSMVLKSDQFLAQMQNETDTTNPASALIQMTKVISPRSLLQFAKSVTALHCKGSINYKEHFDISGDDLEIKAVAQTKEITKGYFCAQCKSTISPNVAKFCFDWKQRFGGKAYCMSCQKSY